ncbi:MAG: hypothetical protein V4534_07900 [Myxococcota bacterium]
MNLLFLVVLLFSNLGSVNRNDSIPENPFWKEYISQLVSLEKKRSEFEFQRDLILGNKLLSADQRLQRIGALDEPGIIRDLARQYAWAIPDIPALRMLQKHSPIIEIGAGAGYWAHLLSEMDVDIVAYDDFSWTTRRKLWFPVKRMPIMPPFERSEPRTLFLCWPPKKTGMATLTLHNYLVFGGQKVIYVGEYSKDAATAEPEFFRLLEKHFELIEELEIPTWPGYHDRLFVYQRI